MSKNGSPNSRTYHQLVSLQTEAQAVTVPHRLGLLHWIHRWARRPRRVFWQLDPITGEWRRI